MFGLIIKPKYSLHNWRAILNNVKGIKTRYSVGISATEMYLLFKEYILQCFKINCSSCKNIKTIIIRMPTDRL